MVKYIIILLILTSCSSTHHLNKAIKKDPTILHNQTIVDTVQITKIDSIPYILNDTIRYKLIERIYDTIINREYKYITPPITRQEKRLSYKLEKQAEKNGLKLDKLLARLEKRTKNVTTRQENKGSKWWVFLLIGLIVGILTRFIKLF